MIIKRAVLPDKSFLIREYFILGLVINQRNKKGTLDGKIAKRGEGDEFYRWCYGS
jgi:hypothetical protein